MKPDDNIGVFIFDAFCNHLANMQTNELEGPVCKTQGLPATPEQQMQWLSKLSQVFCTKIIERQHRRVPPLSHEKEPASIRAAKNAAKELQGAAEQLRDATATASELIDTCTQTAGRLRDLMAELDGIYGTLEAQCVRIISHPRASEDDVHEMLAALRIAASQIG